PGTTAQIDSSAATGGQPPYNYLWAPATALSSTTIPNPTATPVSAITYTLVVTDNLSASDTAFVTVTPNSIQEVIAGNDTSICENSIFFLGGPKNYDNNGINYNWSPATGLNSATSPHPIAKITSTITYTLTATTIGCPPVKDSITIVVIPTPLPIISEGDSITIKE